MISGERGAGKSTLVSSLLKLITVPVYGFITRSMPPDAEGFHSIYIDPAAEWNSRSNWSANGENLIGVCSGKVRTVYPEVFETLGVKYLKNKPDGIILMDEIGFMEKDSPNFCAKVLECLAGSVHTLATVKRSFPLDFLDQVRNCPNATVVTLTPDTREEAFQTLAPIVSAWNDEIQRLKTE